MAELYFIPQQLPRTLRRDQWHSIWRRVRCMRKEISASNQARIDILRKLEGTTFCEDLRLRLCEELVRPPLIMGPGMR